MEPEDIMLVEINQAQKDAYSLAHGSENVDLREEENIIFITRFWEGCEGWKDGERMVNGYRSAGE
jgi:hypothetical protein